MDPIIVGYLSLGAIAIAIYAGLHVAIALAGVSLFGVWAITGKLSLAMNFVALAATDSIADYTFGVVPLFVLMGLAVSESGMGRDTFAVISRGLRRWRGGLGVATVLSNAVFAAITGISVASAAVFSKIAVPEMVRAGTNRSVAVGIVAGSSVLGMLIPPSLLLILFAILTDSSIGDLFIGGIGPGVLLAFAYILYLSGLVRHRRLELGRAVCAYREKGRGNRRCLPDLGRSPRQHGPRLLPHGKAGQSRNPASDRVRGAVLSGQDQRRLGWLVPPCRDHQELRILQDETCNIRWRTGSAPWGVNGIGDRSGGSHRHRHGRAGEHAVAD